MKRTFNIFLCLSLLCGVSLTLTAQSDEEELDQVMLMKQFIGTWEAEVAEDTLVILKFVPYGDALMFTQENKRNGETSSSGRMILGFSQDKKTIIAAGIGKDGLMEIDYGKFVSVKKYLAERYLDNLKHPVIIHEFEFKSPESFTVNAKWRGEKMTWDVEWMGEDWIFNKVE
jgi:hypothetical protein